MDAELIGLDGARYRSVRTAGAVYERPSARSDAGPDSRPSDLPEGAS